MVDIKIATIEATTIEDAWFQCISKILDVGFKYEIQYGSFIGQTRLEFDHITIYIKHPYQEPYDLMLPQIPVHLNIPNPVANGYVEQYMPYLMSSSIESEESYTYGSRLNKFFIQYDDADGPSYGNQIEYWINLLKDTPNTNQAVLQVAQPDDCLLEDPPCMRMIDMRIKNNELIFYPVFRSWDLWCLDEKSEILTDVGWKNIDTIIEDDKIACFDSKTHRIRYEQNQGINITQYKGPMLRINTKRIDQLVTPNHRIFHKYVTHSGSTRKVLNQRYTEAQNLKPKDGSFIPLTAPCVSSEWSLGSIDKAALIGWILTDSHYRKGCKTIEIYQSNKKYFREIRQLLTRLEIPFNETRNKRVYHRIVDKEYPNGLVSICHTFALPAKYCGWIRKLIPDREPVFSLLKLPLEERTSLFAAMIEADGSIKVGRNKTISYAFYSIKAYRLDWFQLLAFSLGYNALLNRKKGCVNISNKQESLVQRKHFNGSMLPTEDYDGRVWCVRTPLDNLVVRRNDKISITGNSGMPANLAGIAVLQKYMADQIGVKSGPIIASSKGLHIYGYCEELAKLRIGK